MTPSVERALASKNVQEWLEAIRKAGEPALVITFWAGLVSVRGARGSVVRRQNDLLLALCDFHGKMEKQSTARTEIRRIQTN